MPFSLRFGEAISIRFAGGVEEAGSKTHHILLIISVLGLSPDASISRASGLK